MKQEKIPSEYLSNDVRDLKKAAIVNRDVELMKALNKSREFSKGWRFYFAKLDESIIRDGSGEPVSIESLGIKRDDFFMYYAQISIARNIGFVKFPEGHYYKSLMSESPHRYKKILVYELPPDIQFPLPDGFGWDQWIEESFRYLRATNQPLRNYADLLDWDRRYPEKRFFPDAPRWKSYTYKHDLGHTIITSSPPKDGRPYTVEEF